MKVKVKTQISKWRCPVVAVGGKKCGALLTTLRHSQEFPLTEHFQSHLVLAQNGADRQVLAAQAIPVRRRTRKDMRFG